MRDIYPGDFAFVDTSFVFKDILICNFQFEKDIQVILKNYLKTSHPGYEMCLVLAVTSWTYGFNAATLVYMCRDNTIGWTWSKRLDALDYFEGTR